MRHKIFTWKTPTNYEDKKPRGLRPINWNPPFEIKSHKFTYPLYPKDLLSSTYNLIHVCDAATTYCSLVNPQVLLKGLWSSTNNLKNQNLEWDNGNGGNDVAIRLSPQRVPLKNKRPPTNSNISMIFLISDL